MKRLVLLFTLILTGISALASGPVRVACIGDSITYGAGLEDPAAAAYPAVLQTLLGENYEVRNFAVSTRTMSLSGDLPYMKEEKYAEAKAFLPEIVTIMLGTNDVKPHNWSEEDFRDSYMTMVTELKALPTHPDIYVCYPPTIHKVIRGIKDSTLVAGVIPILQSISDRMWLEVIDTRSVTAGCREHFADGIHPDAEASKILARAVRDALGANGWGKVPGKKVVFAGDSITDGGWGDANGKQTSARNHYDFNHLYGHGYAADCASLYLEKWPEKNYRFYNRGISGDTLAGLEKRWEQDVLSLRPDVISILVGVNDTGGASTCDTFDFEGWEKRLRGLVDSALAQDPSCRIVLCTPFLAKSGRFGRRANYDDRLRTVRRLAAIVSALAAEYRSSGRDVILADFGSLIDSAIASDKSSDASYWVWDGIHPTYQAHLRMARLWMKKVGKI